MPTESDFLSAADMLARAATSIHAVPSSVDRAFGSHVTAGGQLTLEIETLLMITQISCGNDDGDLDSLAALCRERAAVVSAYSDALGVYGSQMLSYEWAADRWQRNYSDYAQDPQSYAHPGSRPAMPVRPQKPAAWVELQTRSSGSHRLVG